jgi:hypothetical protein
MEKQEEVEEEEEEEEERRIKKCCTCAVQKPKSIKTIKKRSVFASY